MKEFHHECLINIENMRKIVKGDVYTAEEKKKIIEMLKELNGYSTGTGNHRCVKVIAVMDATGSMSGLLDNVKSTIQKYFDTVCEELEKAKYDKSLFKIQIGFYKNYD